MRDYPAQSSLSGTRTGPAAPPPGQPVEQTDLENVAARLHELLSYVQHQRERTEAISDRLLGGLPTPPQPEAKATVVAYAGIVGDMQSALDFIFNNVRSTDDALTRLRNAI